eukprot:gnl/TRDRNA2_/TRDRNA2_207764_c0_seq1.p1 gnl/TRDRNA2_/TRDRNA2_207764_c0~~gnl/TRDRNA2_/TRDRNA2_207764_c0_seq1.p1  ORF type:complete len:241 (+),score=40.41 gnl/TRDRNA2_/TRDRNA2_207764_c0_seq1:66-788(+)
MDDDGDNSTNSRTSHPAEAIATDEESIAARLRATKENALASDLRLPPGVAAWFSAIDKVGAEAIASQDWWKEVRAKQGWTVPAWMSHKDRSPREVMPMHFASGRMSPWYMEQVMSEDRTQAIWAVWMAPYSGNGGKRIGTGQGGAVAALFDMATGSLASAYVGRPSPTANLHVDMRKPARPVPGVWRMDVWIERTEGKKILVKATICRGGSNTIMMEASSLIVDIGSPDTARLSRLKSRM